MISGLPMFHVGARDEVSPACASPAPHSLRNSVAVRLRSLALSMTRRINWFFYSRKMVRLRLLLGFRMSLEMLEVIRSMVRPRRYCPANRQIPAKLESAFLSIQEEIARGHLHGIQIIPETDFIRLNLLPDARSMWLGFEEGKGYFLTLDKCEMSPLHFSSDCAIEGIRELL